MPADAARIGLLMSGGLDSSILLGHLLREGLEVQPIYVRCGVLWQSAELDAARRFVAALDQHRLSPLVELEMPVGDLYADHWSMTGEAVPDEVSPDEAVYLLGRNPLLLLKTALWCQQQEIPLLALATLAGNPFTDASSEFFLTFARMLQVATGRQLEIVRPFGDRDKCQVIDLGVGLPLEYTFSCLSPQGVRHCGRCNKCAERSAAFRQLRRCDPTDYAQTPRASATGDQYSRVDVRVAAPQS